MRRTIVPFDPQPLRMIIFVDHPVGHPVGMECWNDGTLLTPVNSAPRSLPASSRAVCLSAVH
jgi:hypothetical protein